MDRYTFSWTGRRVAVTGATGFIGFHLCRSLVTLGADVTALVRAFSDTSRLKAIGVRCRVAPLEEPVLIGEACRGREFLFHLAGAVDFNNDWDHCRRVNVGGTANVLQAARRAGVRRIVHASSIVAIGASRRPFRLTEDSPWDLGRLTVPYVTTKYDAERLVLSFSGAKDNLSPPGPPSPLQGGAEKLRSPLPEPGGERFPDVIIVNPASVIGPDDFTGSEFGLICRRFWQGRIPFVFGGGSNFVDVRDVAAGMLAAAARGRSGERYILGGANRSYTAFFSELAGVTGRPILRLRLPTGFARAGAAIGDRLRRAHRKRPLLTSAQARLLGLFFYYDCAKSEQELGYRSRPLRETLADTHEFWIVNRDSVRRLAHAA